MVKLSLNSEPREVSAGNVAELIVELGLEPRLMLVELNGKALHRNEWAEARLAEGDQIEMLRVVAGG